MTCEHCAPERLELADDLHLTAGHGVLRVATSRWEPGIFLYDLAFLEVISRPAKRGVAVVMSARGAAFAFQVLRFELDPERHAQFSAFVERARRQRVQS